MTSPPICLEPENIASVCPAVPQSRIGFRGLRPVGPPMLLFCTSFPERRLLQPRGVGTNLLTALYNKMLAGDMRSPLWLVSRLILIPKPLDPPNDGVFHCARSTCWTYSTVSPRAPLFN